MSNKFPIAVLISGNGSNLQAIIDAIESQMLPAEIKLVVSDQTDAFGLQRAARHNIRTAIITRQQYPQRYDYDTALKTLLLSTDIKLIVLSGFMRILSAEFVECFANKIINIHPSLLPKYPGLNTYERALAAGDHEHGSTVHFVTAELDSGPIILQEKLAILSHDTPESLQQRTKILEHQLYPAAIKKVIESKVSVGTSI